MLSNPTRATIVDGEAVGTIRNNDLMPQSWLAPFGRTIAEQVLDAVETRIGSAPRSGLEVMLAGKRIGGAVKAGNPGLGSGTGDGTSEKARKKAEGEVEAKQRPAVLSAWLRGEVDPVDAGRASYRAVTGRASY